MNPLSYIIAGLLGLLTILGFYIYVQSNNLKDMTSQRDMKVLEIAIAKTNISSLEDAIIKYNKVVEKNKIDVEKKHKTFLASIEPTVITRYITKYKKDINESSTECENINSIIDNIMLHGMQ
jgi:hypothetical protein